ERDEACLDPEARDLDAERLRQSLQREFAGRIESLIWGGDETLQSADDEDSALARFAHSRKESLYRSQRPEIIDVHHGLGLFEARVLDGSGEARTCAADQGVDPTLRGVYPFRGLDRRSRIGEFHRQQLEEFVGLSGIGSWIAAGSVHSVTLFREEGSAGVADAARRPGYHNYALAIFHGRRLL